MFYKAILSAVISFLFFVIINCIDCYLQNKALYKINKSILESTAIYFANNDMVDSEINDYVKFVKKNLNSNKSNINKIFDFNAKILNDKLFISYKFKKVKEKVQLVSFEISKNLSV